MLNVRVYANGDDALIAWAPDPWNDAWAGFKVERRDSAGVVTALNNRIPQSPGEGPVGPEGVASDLSPIRRCVWVDHSVDDGDEVCYRVTPMVAAGPGFAAAPEAPSAWTAPRKVSGRAGGGLEAYFNRGTLMSQVVTRMVKNDTTPERLRQFVRDLAIPGGTARRYLSGDARHRMLKFLADADHRGNSVYAALYEVNDQELMDGLKVFGNRGHVLLGNGGATRPNVAGDLAAAGLEVRHRDLSKAGKSSPSVHNKFVVEVDKQGNATRVLTGSTNWTTTGLCTQLNNVLILSRPKVAERFRLQWHALVAAGDDLPAALKAGNAAPTIDEDVTLYFSGTPHAEEFKPVLDLIDGAKEGVLFLMFTPGASPLLLKLIDRAQQSDIYVRGVVSKIMPSADPKIIEVAGDVVRSGAAVPVAGFKHRIEVPDGVPEDGPEWAETEFSPATIQAGGLQAIVHSKAIVIDPFSDDCAVITGSHNFSPAASAKNDENLVIIRGNRALAQAYAVHMSGVYDGYAWRQFLANHHGDASTLYTLDGWKPGGSKHQELRFWMT